MESLYARREEVRNIERTIPALPLRALSEEHICNKRLRRENDLNGFPRRQALPDRGA
jgi:hypothetical protein